MPRLDVKNYSDFDYDFKKLFSENGVKKTLHIIVTVDDYASNVYVSKKKQLCDKYGIPCFIHDISSLSVDHTAYIMSVSAEVGNDGYLLVQKPCTFDAQQAIDQLPEYQDIDGLGSQATQNLYSFGKSYFEPCTPHGIAKIIDVESDITKPVVIVGRSELVGKPLHAMLLAKNYTALLCHSKTPVSVMKALLSIDGSVLVTATGVDMSHLLPLLSDTSLLIDVGIRRDELGRLSGDISRDYYEHLPETVKYTPVPGGIGLLTTDSIFSQIHNDVQR